jgi:hypothetical protein
MKSKLSLLQSVRHKKKKEQKKKENVRMHTYQFKILSSTTGLIFKFLLASSSHEEISEKTVRRGRTTTQ